MRAKSDYRDLALFGGRPLYDANSKLHVGRPNIGNREHLLARINDMLDRRWLTNNGQFVQEFEQRITELVGVRHCITVCNATIGLEVAIRALNLSGEVIVPSFTFAATAHALHWQQIKPVFCDVDPRTHNLDPARVQELITPRTTGILGVHLWGRPCDVDALAAIASRHNLRLFFDAAHAFNCTYKGQMIGNFGDLEVFSFHATKFLNSFEGGAIVTDDDELAKRIRLMINFGFAGYDQVVMSGTNGKMSEVSAAMGLTSLESMNTVVSKNRENLEHYREGLGSLDGLGVINYDNEERRNFQYVVVEVDESVNGISRDTLVDILWAENVMARRYFCPGCHGMEPYRSSDPDTYFRLPVTERLSKRLLTLPTGTSVSVDDIEAVCNVIDIAVQDANDIWRTLDSQIVTAAV